jgi:hypothetical protein
MKYHNIEEKVLPTDMVISRKQAKNPKKRGYPLGDRVFRG